MSQLCSAALQLTQQGITGMVLSCSIQMGTSLLKQLKTLIRQLMKHSGHQPRKLSGFNS